MGLWSDGFLERWGSLDENPSKPPHDCYCVKKEDSFLGCLVEDGGELDESVTLYLTNDGNLKVSVDGGERGFTVRIPYCPFCGVSFERRR